MFDVTNNFFASVPMRTSIDGLVDRIGSEYGFIPPLAEFTLTDVYADIHHKSQSVASLGRKYLPADFSAERCRMQLRRPQWQSAQAELWVGVKDQLPQKLIVTFKNRAGHPEMVTNFTDWNLEAKPPAADFRFVLPKARQKSRWSRPRK